MELLQHLRQYLAERAASYNIFGPLSDDERAARADHDRQVSDMAQRLSDEMAIRAE